MIEEQNPNINPKHYRSHPSGVECIEITRWFNFNLGNAIKYIWRAGLKNDSIEDLEKATWYIQDEIQRLRGLEDPIIVENPEEPEQQKLDFEQTWNEVWESGGDIKKPEENTERSDVEPEQDIKQKFLNDFKNMLRGRFFSGSGS